MCPISTDALVGPRGIVATKLHWATNVLTRYRGLRGREPLDDDEALILQPCRQVHTFGLRETIDVVFIDAEWNVLHVAQMPPRRVSRFVRQARSCVELAGGRAAGSGIEVGVRLTFEASS